MENLYVILFSCFVTFAAASTLDPKEVAALNEIGSKLGKKWNFDVDPCSGEKGWGASKAAIGEVNSIVCNCSLTNTSDCHVISILLSSQSLSGVLPPELVKLPYLQHINFVRNFLSGTIPKEWGSLQLVDMSLSGNRLSGSIPVEITNITTLKYVALEFNQFSGVLPHQLGSLVNIERLLLSSNNFSGRLPETLAELINLKDLWINDNNFSGTIPSFVQNWTNLETIMMHASGLEGPFPLGISRLSKMRDMRITDLNGPETTFPQLSNMTNLTTLILRSCKIAGEIPAYLGSMKNLETLDLSFNQLTGEIPRSFDTGTVSFIFLTGNALTGFVPPWMLKGENHIDLSFNNFTLETASSPTCQKHNLNLFHSSSWENNLTGLIPCITMPCRQNRSSFRINCGGPKVHGSITFDDDEALGGPASLFQSSSNWLFSSTGKFMDTDTSPTYIKNNLSGAMMTNNPLYMTARLSPVSLTYYGYCLVNGKYTVDLHFAEILFENGNTYKSLGRRIFDVYIQKKLVLKDFNIVVEAGGVGKAVRKSFTAVVTSSTLEIRFHWAGKGTEAIPIRGIYGPLVSAISVDRDIEHGKKLFAQRSIVIILILSALSVLSVLLGVLWWKGCFGRANEKKLDLQTASFSLRQIKRATNNFRNKIGEGGFGPVYKGYLSDGTIIAVKQLSSRSNQGNREFVNEIGMISALQHPNLVKLYGCCMEGNQLLLIYEYMENNSLARALFGREEYQLKLDWPTRHNICVDIAKALVYLHEESRLKIVHRDLKADNILLDKNFEAKISDFGLAKLDEEDNSHISTRIAGTLGYMAPEYATRGYLTDKADVYSFGVVSLEIVSGRSNTNFRAREDCVFLLDWAAGLKENGDLMELIDPRLELNYNREEVVRMIDVALQCTNVISTLRPTMSSVLSTLQGRTSVQNLDLSNSDNDKDLKEIGNQYHHLTREASTSDDQTQCMLSTMIGSN